MTVNSLEDERMSRVRKVVCALLEVDEEKITESELFIEDYNADSLQAIEILAGVEREFGVVIGQDKVTELVNLRSVYDVVAEAAGW
ncbi:acyl carrier protein [Amycolatopsis sp. CA-230715]|uniref:acyl carrier protein n=1 Tax=Amycolatopsis sp. CA-230715 TaxID=2745196 RepID=UPI001C328279|nr:acyl carrier protein [Amycolatopsis sp. CA-230715]QWF84494.1 Acyl carrier protein [Amycolatopsis sp. CA-230715]